MLLKRVDAGGDVFYLFTKCRNFSVCLFSMSEMYITLSFCTFVADPNLPVLKISFDCTLSMIAHLIDPHIATMRWVHVGLGN